MSQKVTSSTAKDPKLPTFRIAIQEYSYAHRNYNKGIKTFFVRFDKPSEIKGWLQRFETLLKGMSE